MLYQRPDQRVIPTAPGTVPGSRSGSPEAALSLQQTGVPPLVPGLKTAQKLHQNVGIFNILAPAQDIFVWGCILSSSIDTNASFSLATAATFAVVQTASGITLGVVELAVGGPNQAANGQSPPLMFGIPISAGDVIQLSVNGGTPITNLNQNASAIVFHTPAMT